MAEHDTSESPKQSFSERRAKRRLAAQAEKEVLEERHAAKKAKEAAFKASVVDGYVVDKDGNRLRRYGVIERILDHKPLAYGIAFGFLALCLLALYLTTNGSMLAPQ
ncbi:MAG: hypothetical protein LBD25_08975 [Coriobacteriales bacterium]|jgi:hypothetical protein|nr:hypothetical protein [Coriobacteriales bacterium]